MKKITSTDIARIAGVSRSTVSRVINNYHNVPKETRDRILGIIAENEYYPDLPAQQLAGKSNQTIGFFYVTKGGIHDDFLSSSFMVSVIEAAADLGYLVLTCMIDDIHDKERAEEVKSIFMQGRIEAGIFIGVNNYEPLIENLISLGKIVGVFDQFSAKTDDYNRISANFDRNTGEQAIDYVYSMGHRKISIIDGNLNTLSGMERHISFIKGMQKHNIDINTKWMLAGINDIGGYRATKTMIDDIGGYTVTKTLENDLGGYAATKTMINNCKDDMPTVICANNDSTAFGVYKALKEANIRIPEDISVIGIDGHAKGAYVDPPLTTFDVNFHEMFSSLVRRTVQVIDNDKNVQSVEWMETLLIERESCKRLSV